MKKLLSFVLSVMMILTCAPVAMAEVTFEEGTEVAYEIGEATLGEKVAVPVNLVFSDSYNGDVGTGKVILAYDSAKLTYDSFDKHIGGSVNVNARTEGVVQFNVTPDEAFTESTALVTLYFIPVEGATGDTAITFTKDRMNAVDAAGTRLDFQTVDGKVAFPPAEVAKYDVTFATTIGTAPEAMNDVEEGTEITLPALTDAELTFLGWTIAGSETVYAAGSKYAVNGDVEFTAKWGGGKKIYISNDGADTNDGFTAETPVKTLTKANALLAEEGKDTLVVVGTFTTEKNGDVLGVAGKTITVTGNDNSAVFDYDAKKGDVDDNLVLAGDIIFKNIAINEGSGDGVIQVRGNTVTFEEGIKIANSEAPIEVAGWNGSPTINIKSGTYGRVYPGAISGTFNGGTTIINISGGTVNDLGLGWGWRGSNKHYGTYYANINGGTVKLITLRSNGIQAANSYKGLRYYTINDGTVESIVTTGGSQYKNNANPQATLNVEARTGVTVFEINKADVVTGTIALGTNIITNQPEEDNATRIVIYNNGSYKADQVTDTGAFVYNVKNGALKAEVTVKDDCSALLEGFTYTLPEGSTFNAVKYSSDAHEDLTGINLLGDDLIAPMSVVGTYDIEFVNAYEINLDNEDVIAVEAGAAASLPVYPAKGDLNHIGWATTEGATVPTIGLEDEFIPTGNTTLYSVWASFCNVDFETAYGVAPEGYKELATGSEITLPELASTDDILFLGWAVNGGEEIIPGNTKYTLTGTVNFVAKWKSMGKVYISDNGADGEGRGLTADAPLLTLDAAGDLIWKEQSDALVVVDYFTVGKNSTKRAFGDAEREIIITGATADAVFDYNTTPNATDDSFTLNGSLLFKNIKINGDQNDGRIITNGFSFTAGEGVEFAAANATSRAPKISVDKDAADAKVILESGKYSAVYPGRLSGGTFAGKSTVEVSEDAEVGSISLGHGFRQTQSFSGEAIVEVNSGKVNDIGVMSSSHTNMATNAYRGVRYFTINGGEVGNIFLTDSAEFASYNWSTSKFNVHQKTAFRTGLTIVEINKAGTVTGTIAPGTEILVKEDGTTPYVSTEYAYDDATRVVIYNNGSYVEDQVKGEGTYVLNVKNGALKPSYQSLNWDGADYDALLAWIDAVELLGFTYELPAEGTFNAVKVGDKIYRLAELENDLIPVPAEAGVADVEFINAYKVTVGEETTLVAEGDTINLTRLPQNGDLKHIGWATTEGATTATIDHTTEYAPTADVTLYPVWADAVYFTVSFVSAHGDAFDAISKIDDDEDGAADETVVLPGYDTAIKYDDHFTFVGWATTEGAEAAYVGGGIIEQLSENMVLYAVWMEDPKATVTYVDTAATAPEAVTDYVGTEITVAAPGTVEGFEFLGWTDGATVYQAGDKLTIDEDGATLTAKWGVKVAVDANGGKGDLPVIGGAIGEEIDLPTSVELTKVNCTFVGFALAADGEVITGKYTVNPDDTLYVIWEETVANAGIIETKVVYNSASGDYTVDMYFYGADANTVAFGYTYGENLEFVSFTPAEDLSKVPAALETNGDGYYAFAVTDTVDGRIEGAAAEAGNGVHLGTLNFTYKLTKDDYSDDDAADNIAITAPAAVVEYISSEDYFLYTPAVVDLEVTALPVVFDEAIEYEIIDVIYTVNGSVKVIRADGTAPKNFAAVAAYVNGNLYKIFTIEDAETVTADGVFEYSIELPAGEYTLVFDKAGYASAELDVTVEVQEGAGEDGFVPTPVDADLVTLIPGDVVEEADVIDLLDFAAITSSFGRGALADEIVIALDINEDGAVTVDDLAYVKANFGYGA